MCQFAPYYDPTIGRFISEDSLWGTADDPLSLNLYTYCTNNPIKYVDPTGHYSDTLEYLYQLLDLQDAYLNGETEGAHETANDVRNNILNSAAVLENWSGNNNTSIGDILEPIINSGFAGGNSRDVTLLMINYVQKSWDNHIREQQRMNSIQDTIVSSVVGIGGSLVKGLLGKVVGKAALSFSSGKAGEQYLAQLVGGQSQAFFRTTLGRRFVDQLANGIAHESKVGYTSLTSFVRNQVLKDAQLINSGNINGATWHFFKSSITGQGGASQPLLDFLTKNGIKYIIE